MPNVNQTRLGVEYFTKIGYDAHEMAGLFYTLEKEQKGGQAELPEFLSTHPIPGDRNEAVKKLATE